MGVTGLDTGLGAREGERVLSLPVWVRAGPAFPPEVFSAPRCVEVVSRSTSFFGRFGGPYLTEPEGPLVEGVTHFVGPGIVEGLREEVCAGGGLTVCLPSAPRAFLI